MKGTDPLILDTLKDEIEPSLVKSDVLLGIFRVSLTVRLLLTVAFVVDKYGDTSKLVPVTLNPWMLLEIVRFGAVIVL